MALHSISRASSGRALVVIAFALAAATGCDKNAATAPAKSPPNLTQLTKADIKPSGADSNVDANTNSAAQLPPGVDASVETNGLHVSDAIARACALPKQETRASFEFDSAAIGEDDKTLLASVAKCLTEGALQGRRVSLIGRADPRGENEYNMSLGGSRSESVKKYLHDLGVPPARLGSTSRGEIDATGTNEDGWAKDRRVDIELVN